ncbi:sensor histidine kinase [Luteimonas panaciterrae]|uniref:sensor histidine kinase n=1 Tax=Luteimonas panaciterrae TaxID=363885 RepID=UPI001CFA609B|nr:HAMP domain-containing sensor histidine kinase [Luteimonas panaciterrae]
MLHQFLKANRPELIARCRAKVAARSLPGKPERELDHGITVFLDQLIKTLRVEQSTEPMRSRKVSGPAGGTPSLSEMGETAAQHGRELLQHGFTVDEVVHDYGDLCQAVTDLAFEQGASIEVDEFRTLNRCLDNAIAVAVMEFGYQRDFVVADKQANELNERLGSFAHELRNLLATATLAVAVIKEGNVGLSGATGTVLDRSLVGLRNLIDRSLAEVRMEAGLPVEHQLFSLADFIAEVKMSASLEAQLHDCILIVSVVDPRLAIAGDHDLLMSAIGNLLQNAFKFTKPNSEVTLNAYAAADRILIDVEDNCGGLPAGDAERMFRPFIQNDTNKSGLGLGLSIARRSVEVNGGVLSVRDVPGSGCIFTIDLPRHAQPDTTSRAFSDLVLG